MDNRKLRYAKRKAKEKILSQRNRAYYRNLNFRENPNEQAEESPEHYAAQNMAGYGRKYANMVKAQGRKLFIRQKEREWQRNPFLFGRLFLAACRKESRRAEKQQNYHIKRKPAAEFTGSAKKANPYFLCPTKKRLCR